MAEGSGVWDLPGPDFRSGISPASLNFIRNPYNGSGSVLPQTPGRSLMPPPLPPRPGNFANNYNYQGSYFNNFGFGGYPNYGGSTYGYGYGYRPGFNSFGYGFGQNNYYNGNNPESRFIQLAEESSRPAFQAIQSVLHSFSSVAMMFDSTFNALYSSYMSVISVADNFGKLRSTFGQVFSLLAVFKTLYWIYRRLLYMLGISKTDPQLEHFWTKAQNITVENSEKSTQNPWFMRLFLSLIIAGPYLLFKLLSNIYPNPNKEAWSPERNPGTTAVGMYDFHSMNEQELSFSVNQKIMIAPAKFQPSHCPGWILACNKDKKIGLVPKNYVGIMMRSEKTGKPYIEHNGQNYEINNYVAPENSKNSEEPTKD